MEAAIIAGLSGLAVMCIWLYGIFGQLRRIADYLSEIAKAWKADIRITVPGNKDVRINLPDGGKIGGTKRP